MSKKTAEDLKKGLGNQKAILAELHIHLIHEVQFCIRSDNDQHK